MKIEIQGQDNKKPDFKLALVPGYGGCINVVAYDKDGEHYNVVYIGQDGEVSLCYSDLSDIN
jgi:hypothetical protein